MSMLLVLSSQLLPVRTPPRSPERGASSSLYARTGVHQYVLSQNRIFTSSPVT